MDLSPSVKRLSEKLMEHMGVPPGRRKIGLKLTLDISKDYARQRGHHFVRKEDFLDAVKQFTPRDRRTRVIKSMRKCGVNVNEVFADWHKNKVKK